MKRTHQMPFGAECRPGGVRFRLWAPQANEVNLRLHNSSASTQAFKLSRLEDGWFELLTDAARAGSRYRFLINGQTPVPDPASRFQPADVHGPSEVIDPASFNWTDADWRGRSWDEAVIYELHVGTFTPEGSFAAVQQQLDYLVDLGITAIELMPIGDFPGTRNWGYDAVLLYAPDSSYGRPEDLKRLIDTAHARHLMVFLDVVYNHFGPEGNYLRAYSPQFFTDRHHTPWGEAINFDGPCSQTVREFFIHNALYWLEEFHFDGLRLDAVHAIVDETRPDFLTELAEYVREYFGSTRRVHLVLENDNNAAHYLQRDSQNCPRWYNAQWNDDFHHAAHVLLTGEQDGYYGDYRTQPIVHLARCLAEGFDYQGESSQYREGNPRGEPSRGLPATAFVSFLQNHDQVGNRGFGERILKLADEQALQVATAILCLAPSVPLLFMGEEFAAETPFLFFCDFEPKLAEAVTQGRRNEFARFASFNRAQIHEEIPDPGSPDTFSRSKLDWQSLNRPRHQRWLHFYRELLSVRRTIIIPRLAGLLGENARYRTWGDCILSVEWHLADETTLSLIANLGKDATRIPAIPLGRVIYAIGAADQVQTGTMPPCSVAWFLTP